MAMEVKSILWMMWRGDQGEIFKVGELSRKGQKHYFEYDNEGVKKAETCGFAPLQYFPRTDAKYFREELFHSFSVRLPGNGKKDSSVLKEYDLEEYDAFELLKKCGGKISTDSFEFILPFDKENVVLDTK